MNTVLISALAVLTVFAVYKKVPLRILQHADLYFGFTDGCRFFCRFSPQYGIKCLQPDFRIWSGGCSYLLLRRKIALSVQNQTDCLQALMKKPHLPAANGVFFCLRKIKTILIRIKNF